MTRSCIAWIRAIASMPIEGECEEHGPDCDGEREDCVIYSPTGNEDEIDTLYSLIDEARSIVAQEEQGDNPH